MRKITLTLAMALITLAAMAQGWPAQYEGVMLQGFGWGSYSYTQWSQFTQKAPELSQYFDLIWVPQSGTTKSWQGYLNNEPKQANGYALSNDEMLDAERQLRENGYYLGTSWSSLNLNHQDDIFDMGYMCWKWLQQESRFGTEDDLRNMIQVYKGYGTGIIEDVVINHKDGSGDSGMDYPNESVVGKNTGKTYTVNWDNTNHTDVCAYDWKDYDHKTGYFPGGGNEDSGENIPYCPDLDHKGANVQNNVCTYLDYLRDEIGYTGFRFDAAKGFDGKYMAKYIEHTTPTFAVGEIWDSQDRINRFFVENSSNTEPSCAAFDFSLKWAINDAFKSGNWGRLNAVGTITDWRLKRYSITFVDNHDTRREYWSNYDCSSKSGGDGCKTEAANAFLLMMPGTPCILYEDYLAYTKTIQDVIKIRHAVGIHNQSGIEQVVKWNDNKGIQFRISGKHGEAWINLGAAADRSQAHTGFTEAYFKQGDFFIEYTTGLDWTAQSGRVTTVNGYPVIDKNSGNYTGGVQVNIRPNCKECTLVYTTNGKDPDAGSKKITYSESGTNITIDKTTTLKVGVLVDGVVVDGSVVSRDYVINDNAQGTVKVYLKVQGAYRNADDDYNLPQVYAWNDNGYENDEFPGWGLFDFKETVGGVEWYVGEFATDRCNLIFSWKTQKPGEEASTSGKTADINNVQGTVFYTFEYGMAYDLTAQYINSLKDPTVSIEMPSGEYTGSVTTRLTPSFGKGIIVYTTDGVSEPTATITKNAAGEYVATATGNSIVANGATSVTLNYKEGDAQVIRAAIVNPQDGKLVNQVARTYWIAEGEGGGGNVSSETVTENIPTTGTNIFVKKSTYKGNGSLYVHAWVNGGDPITKWPGYKFTESDVRKVNNVEYYYKHFDNTNISIDLNVNGNNKYEPSALSKAGSYYYEYTGTSASGTDISTSSGNVTVTPETRTPDATGKIIVFVRNSSNSSNVPNIYYRTTNGTTSGPTKMSTSKTVNVNNQTWYYQEFTSGLNLLIFSESGDNDAWKNQTKNIGPNETVNVTFSNGNYYWFDYQAWDYQYGENTWKVNKDVDYTSKLPTTGGDRTNKVTTMTKTVVTADPINIYVQSSVNPYIWAYNDDNSNLTTATEWPGDKMTTKTVDGKTWYYLQINKNVADATIIINNGNSDGEGNQSKAFSVVPGDYYFNYDGKTTATLISGNADVKLPSCVVPLTGDVKYCYFENDHQFYSPYIYLWSAKTETIVGAWPGEALVEAVGTSPSGNTIYRWTYDGDLIPVHLNFSERGTNDAPTYYYKTEDFDFVNGGYYNSAGLQGTAGGSVWKLADILRSGVDGEKYIIDNDLYAAYYNPKSIDGSNGSLFVRDADGEAVNYNAPQPGDKIYVPSSSARELIDDYTPGAYEQANWIEIRMPAGKSGIGSWQDLEGKTIMGQTFYGTYKVENGNPVLVTEYTPVDINAVSTPHENVYSPANFLSDHGDYFLVEPKPNEVMVVKGVIYKDGAFYADPRSGLGASSTEAITVGTEQYWNDGSNFSHYAGLLTEEQPAFEAVRAVVKYNSAPSTVPAINGRGVKNASQGGNYTLQLITAKANESVITAIDDIKGEPVAKTVKAVKYYNLTGVESDSPFSGVNIVVTTYTDGTRSSAKMVR